MIFKFLATGYFSGYFELVYKKKHVTCFISDYPVRPSEPSKSFSVIDDPDWKILLQYLKNLKWKASYSTEMLDGTQWSVEFKHGDSKIKTESSNAYPRGFKTFIQLLNKTTRKHGIVVEL